MANYCRAGIKSLRGTAIHVSFTHSFKTFLTCHYVRLALHLSLTFFSTIQDCFSLSPFNNDHLSSTIIMEIFCLPLRFPISLLLISLGNYSIIFSSHVLVTY
jgi:hypothetical protein